MDYLLIDFGNSRLKWAWDHGGRLEYGEPIDHGLQDWPAQLAHQLGHISNPDQVYVCSVAGQEKQHPLRQWLAAQWSVPVTFIDSPKVGNGIANAYAEPATLGSDRWAAMVAAYHKAKGAVCVVDCGTAVTIDVVDHKGRHLGGTIVPGLNLMLASLAAHTHAVPDPDASGLLDGYELGTDTLSCIGAGGIHAVAGLVERMVQQMNRRLETTVECFITGGDARRVIPHLELRTHFEPHLVLQGLALIARAA